ncbi:polyribonucleotide nucleotidyltransferase [Wolbachia endosymbiont of Aedes albopictus]|uniref:polyribonucleotide nucleotidyltransferase n=1 Tax=Wolbachia endosymbiont of Aedes albopictus TaxID=167957 RepID=UPI000BBC93E3|nr:polyribonucleotide nucleotidyltransferase [Wolbachia endosymbiont of Aedes albopictus]TVS97101.1 polyribonucleotide nucleotidyltransferase [Wolbachia pipientis]UVW84088.1 polyribonucleotide nucleotidyltransferase [Wolbachia endosymbiont of Aedes albopictus]
MFKIIKKSIEWGGRALSLETGKIARQAHGSVVVNYGDTSVLVTVVRKEKEESVDFLPLNVQFIAKSYAMGKIPGGFFKREGKPSDRETLISRVIDRSVRPLFPEGFHDEISVVCNLLTYDTVNPPEVPALIGAVAALAISGVPFHFTIAGVIVGCDENNNYILNPSVQEMKASSLDLFLSGDENSILMVESEVKELSEENVFNAIKFGHEHLKPVIKLIKEFADTVGNKPESFAPVDTSDITQELEKYGKDFEKAYLQTVKQERVQALEAVRENILNTLKETGKDEKLITYAIKNFERSLVREIIRKKGVRIDGRKHDEIRQIEVEVDVLSRTHGSALFTRGNTQALVVTALGTTQDEQIVDDIEGDRREHFMLHYNFPSFAVGETSAARAPGRREIGHGKLAWKAIHPVLPDKSEFPYTIRVVSEIMESDGSSSMATVCGTSLALMDTGVPIKAPVAGIAMGLIQDKDEYVILSDILGDEDYLGDMDFKVAGTSEGVTALQMDMKISGISFEIVEKSLEQAKAGRLHILEKMNAVISEHSDDVKDHAPRMLSFYIDKDKISAAIGAKGKNIRSVCERSNAKIEIGDDGKVSVFATSGTEAEIAKSMMIDSITELEQGSIVDVKVVKIEKSIVELEFLNGRKGKMHISEVANEHIDSIESILKQGDTFKALVIDFEKGGCPKLSRRRVDQETGEFFEGELYNEERKDGPNDRDNYYNNSFNRKPGGSHHKRPSRPRSGFSNRNRPKFGNNDSSSGFY